MKRYIFTGVLLGLCVPFSAIIVNQIAPDKYNFIFLLLNPFGWIFILPGRLCQTELCAGLFLVIGVVFAGWAILGGLIGFLVYKVKQSRNFKKS
jgi:hypothetical protein